MDYDLTYRTARGAFTFSLAKGIIIGTLDGFTGLPVTISTAQSIYQYGADVSSQTIETRTLVIGGIIYKDVADMKARLLDVFIPFEEGTLIVNGKHEIGCYVKTTPDFAKTRKYASFAITLFCPFPFFKDKEKAFVDMKGFVPEFQFPWNLTETYRFASVSQQQEFAVVNGGQYPTGYELTFIAGGTVKNPKVILQNSLKKDLKSLKVMTTMKDGERITIKSNEKGVVAYDKNGEDVTGAISFDSDFFSIPVGDSVIFVTADDSFSAQNLDGTLSFSRLRGGVVL